MLDIPSRVRVHVDALIAAQHDMRIDVGVCDAIERREAAGKPAAMSAPHLPKVAGIDPAIPVPAHTAPPLPTVPTAGSEPGALIQDRLAGWVSGLTTLHELTERLTRTSTLDEALHELLRAGASLVGARRGMAVLEPADGQGPTSTVGLGLAHADLGTIETVPRSATSYGRILDGLSGGPLPDPRPSSPTEHQAVPGDGAGGAAGSRAAAPGAVAVPDILGDEHLDPRHREVAARLGFAASYAVPLAAEGDHRLGAVVWLYDEPAEPDGHRRHLVGLYGRYASEHLARLLELERGRAEVAALTEELLPTRLPRVPGVRLAARQVTGALGGGDWYDALPLPEGALGLAVGSVSGAGPRSLAAVGRLRASLRAYAVMEGEDPVAVLSDLELLLRLTEPARSATVLFAYAEPARRRIVLAGAGHAPPLVVGDRRTEYVETSLSAPLGMLACWEAPSVDFDVQPGETVLLYTDGLLRRIGGSVDRAFARLHTAAASVPKADRDDPGAVVDHVLRLVLGTSEDGLGGWGGQDGDEGAVMLAARFD
ncbi:PP2C family protein-serine/threonine phosphatase [Streptomyces sp. TRM76323]|uniref:PP2C family protein-serine/threonine phosphatase n=1 Tax=Streptomyces tamarix TaxID=3078565 RepID=A0ABU3QGG2_9ACTN|nr:PP2C family protein-serine/threonine phosphatase [Streptomyces tamarix]MDT9681834.1 PP2C family protein-serine/threonine phosphatase [Streptomyces tamarix]